jgi:predicted transcriptional regulator
LHRPPARPKLDDEIPLPTRGLESTMRKLIELDDDTFAKLKQLARDRMATFQELADEAFADLMKKHGIPLDLRDALKKSAAIAEGPAKQTRITAKTRNKHRKKK